LKIGVLLSTDDDFVPATAHLNQADQVNIVMRLKGDWTDHIQGDKWSFRIHTQNGALIDGMRQFSIQSPDTRPFLLEWLMHLNLRDEGILTPRYEFLNVLINGEYKGVYALEENFTTELIEAQGRKPGLIIRFDEDPLWQNRAATRAQGVSSDGIFSVANIDSTDITPFGAASVAASPELDQEAEAAMGKLRAFQVGTLPASQVFDVGLMGRFYALSDLWAACHGTFWHNLRFYYNPITTLLEPVVFDLEPMNCGAGDPTVYTNFESILPEFIKTDNRIFGDPLIRQAYAQELNRVANAAYLQNIFSKYDPQYQSLKKALLDEYTTAQLTIPTSQLETRTKRLMVQLKPGAPVRGGFEITGSEQSPVLKIEVVNLMLLPVEVVRFEVRKVSITAQTSMISLDQQTGLVQGTSLPTLLPVNDPAQGEYAPTAFSIPLNTQQFNQLDLLQNIQVVVRLAGLSQEFTIPLLRHNLPQPLINGPKPPTPGVDELVAKFPFLIHPAGSNRLEARPGVWDVQADLVIPPGLEVVFPGGVTLRFGQQNVLLSYSPLSFLGSEDRPVVLTASEQTWPGLVVLDTGKPSLWQYTRVEKTRGISRSGWITTGGVTFYRSPLTLEQVSILDSQAESAINVVNSPYSFTTSEFGQSAKAAFASDYSDGEVTDCSFHDTGGDGVDIRGGHVTLQNSRLLETGGQAISSSEASRTDLIDVQIENVRVGIASKDLAAVYTSRVTIRNASLAGLAAYTMNPMFGPGKLSASETQILDTETNYLVQTGSTLSLNGKVMKGVELDMHTTDALGIPLP